MAKNNLTSPGVQITEKDLSLRANFTPGTNVVVPGFASQGPTVEPISISTASELEAIFGIPSTPAERYFYYSCRQIIDSPGNLIAMRLPYGTSTGSGFSQKYAGLFYPALTADDDSRVFAKTVFSNIAYSATSLSAQSFAVEVSSGLVKAFHWAAGGVSTQVDALTSYVNSLAGGVVVNLGDATSLAEMIYSITGNIGTGMTLASTFNSLTLSQKTLRTATYTASAVGTATVATTAGGGGELKTAWSIQAPVHVELSETQYNNLKNGNFEWITPSISSSNAFYLSGTGNAEIYSAAGFFVLNTLQTSINEIGEGYYLGFADNSALYADSPDFVSISKINTVGNSTLSTIPASYNEITDTRIDFALSATSSDSIRGVNSISESLEKVGFVGFESNEYQDYLSLGLFRIRRSAADAVTLTLGTTETFLGSLDYNRKRIDPNGAGGNLPSSFVEEVINNNSSQIKIFVNPAISRAFSWSEGGSTIPTNRVKVDSGAKGLFPIGAYQKIAQGEEITKVIGEVPVKLDKAFRMIENPETLVVDLVLDAGLSTTHSTTKIAQTSSYNDETYVDSSSFDALYLEWKSVVDQFVTFTEKTRKDCMAIIDVPRPFLIVGKDQKAAEAPDKNFQTDVYNPLRQCLDPIETNYAASYANWVKLNDLFTGKKFWHPFSGAAGGIYAYNDNIAYPWSAPAGLNRGIFNCLDIALNPNQKQRDRLYEIALNPVAYFSGDGFAVMGQKTLQNKPTAFDRVNVRRLFLSLERATQRALKYFVFEPNTEFTRTRLKNVIAPLFEYAKNTEGLYDYLIVCDSRNNLPETIDNNELIVDIYLKPVRTAEFILVNFIATRTGQNFSELI